LSSLDQFEFQQVAVGEGRSLLDAPCDEVGVRLVVRPVGYQRLDDCAGLEHKPRTEESSRARARPVRDDGVRPAPACFGYQLRRYMALVIGTSARMPLSITRLAERARSLGEPAALGGFVYRSRITERTDFAVVAMAPIIRWPIHAERYMALVTVTPALKPWVAPLARVRRSSGEMDTARACRRNGAGSRRAGRSGWSLGGCAVIVSHARPRVSRRVAMRRSASGVESPRPCLPLHSQSASASE
jgi:hypothetical protein